MSDDLDAGEDRPRPVLLGEAPSRGGDAYSMFPLSGRPARVLCELAGIPPQQEGTRHGRWTWALYDHFDCRNVFERYASAAPWSRPRAREAAHELLAQLKVEARVAAGVDIATPDPVVVMATSPTVVVCLGRKVQAAVFGALDGDIRHGIATGPGRWDTGFFGDFGVWAAPQNIYAPTSRVCEACGGKGTWKREIQGAGFNGRCEGGWCEHCDRSGRIVEHRWAPHVVTIPHPSGLNRLLNDEDARARCGKVLCRALEVAASDGTVAP